MFALSGTLLNAATVLVGALLGTALGDRLPERLRLNVVRGVGLFTLAMGAKFAIDTSNLLYLLGSMLLGGIAGVGSVNVSLRSSMIFTVRMPPSPSRPRRRATVRR